jgi:uncharacterized protein involved in exopolysaccharide biosynthesis
MLDTLALLHRRRRLFVRVFLGGTLLVLLSLYLRGPAYQATATLMVTAERARATVSPEADTRPMVMPVTDEDLNTEATLLQGEELRREVLAPLATQGIDRQGGGSLMVSTLTFPLRLPGILYRVLYGIRSDPIDEWIRQTGRRLDVGTIKKSNLIEVSFSDEDPEWAARFVNDLVAHHIERHGKLGHELEARKFFKSQSALLGDRLTEASRAEAEFYEREGWDSMPERRSVAYARLDELEAAQQAANTELATAKAQVSYLTEEIKKYPRSIKTQEHLVQNQAVQIMKGETAKLELQRRDLLTRYAPDSIRVRDVEEQLAQAKNLVEGEAPTVAESVTQINPIHQRLEADLATAKTQVAATSARITALDASVAVARARLRHLDGISPNQQRFAQGVTDAKDALVTYTRKEEEARLSSALDESRLVNIAIAQTATVPLSPKNAHRSLTLVLGLVLSAALGVAAAFVRDRIDPSVKSASEAERLTGFPVLAEV